MPWMVETWRDIPTYPARAAWEAAPLGGLLSGRQGQREVAAASYLLGNLKILFC